jgi:hypothetical protein
MGGIPLECDTASAGLNAAGSCDVTPMRRGRAAKNGSWELVIVRGIAGVARSSASGLALHWRQEIGTKRFAKPRAIDTAS